MEVQKTVNKPLKISGREFLGLVSQLIGGTSGLPDPENPTPPGPWDPYIRKALFRLGLIFGPVPDPWEPVFGPGPQPWSRVALNPQPLPPRVAFAAAIAGEVIERASLVQEIADALGGGEQSQGSIGGGMIARFIDDCGNGILWRKRPFPPPKSDSDNMLTALELVVMGLHFERNAFSTTNQQLQQEFRDAGARLAEMGLARL
jgi:hypothetical protein